jgi:hypothetical protein
MLKKIITVIGVAMTASAFAQSVVPGNSRYDVTVFSDGEQVFRRGFSQLDGTWATQGGFNRKDQVSLQCDGDKVKSLQSVERNTGVQVATIRDSGELRVKVDALWVRAQDLPKSIPVCKEISANTQERVSKTVAFSLAGAVLQDQFQADIGSGYVLSIRVAR